jgi:hypothetical protein
VVPMASLKDEVKRTSSKSRIFVYEEDLHYLDRDNFEEELEKVLDYSRDAFIIASNRLNELGLTLVDSPADQNSKLIGEPKDIDNGRKVVAFSVNQDLYTKIQERRGEMWDADFLNIAINHYRDMRKLHDRYSGRQETIRIKKNSAQMDDSDEENDLEELEEHSENEKVEASFLGMDVDFDKTSKILWVLGLALFGVGDTTTTYWSLMKGNVETNPILAFLLGLNPLVMISFKIAIICAFYVLFAVLKNRNGKDSYLLWIPTIMIILGGYLTINNLLVIIRT